MIILSIGGSLIAPTDHSGKTIGTIEHAFVRDFKKLILAEVKRGEKFVIVTGGGGPCRAYVHAVTALAGKKPSQTDLHWIGIMATKLNAEFFRVLFNPLTHPIVSGDPTVKLPLSKPILIGAGYAPGHSTDMDSVILAKTYGAKHVMNLTNIDYVYSADPRKDKNAKPFHDLSWKEYKKILGVKKHAPAAHVPFDPVATDFAQRHGLTVTILNGAKLSNIRKALRGEAFVGTTLHP